MLLQARQPLGRIFTFLGTPKQERATARVPRPAPATRFQPADPHQPYARSQAPEAVLVKTWWSAPFSWR
jgi:hypothetical protein